VLNLLGQYLRRTAERGGVFWDYELGISLGCPLSPLIGAFFLKELDQRMARSGLFYLRFMDDILVLAPTRWKPRKAVKAVNEVWAHCVWRSTRIRPTGSIERGFDFLGYHSARRAYPWPRRPSRISLNLRSGFTSKNRGRLAPPPGLDRTKCGGGSGGRPRGLSVADVSTPICTAAG
jgi:hypothetical protein